MSTESLETRIKEITAFNFKGLSIPETSAGALARYLEQGIPTGDFLKLMLSHDIYHAAGHADHLNIEILHVYIAYMYNHMPMNSHGSAEIVNKWLESFRKEIEDKEIEDSEIG